MPVGFAMDFSPIPLISLKTKGCNVSGTILATAFIMDTLKSTVMLLLLPERALHRNDLLPSNCTI
jgi:hypothetical protein